MKKFNLLAYLLPPEEKIFYVLFETGTKICRDAAVLFNEIVTSALKEEHIIAARSLKHKSSDLFRSTLKELNRTFVTPIEREDIQNIATLLNKIAKKILKVCFNLRVYRLTECNDYMVKQSETLLRAADELVYIIKKFKKVSSVQKMLASNLRMKEVETHGDEILYMAMDELFSGNHQAVEIIKLKDIYKDIEDALDSCYEVSDQIVNIVLKQS